MRSTELIDPTLVAQATVLRHRAESLRQQATGLGVVLAASYRRRAAELELQAWALDAHAGVREDDVAAPVATAA